MFYKGKKNWSTDPHTCFNISLLFWGFFRFYFFIRRTNLSYFVTFVQGTIRLCFPGEECACLLTCIGLRLRCEDQVRVTFTYRRSKLTWVTKFTMPHPWQGDSVHGTRLLIKQITCWCFLIFLLTSPLTWPGVGSQGEDRRRKISFIGPLF